MSLSTRESMRRELKELAKLAETMGKGPVESGAESENLFAAPAAADVLQRPATPNGSSRVTVPPIATSTSVSPSEIAELNAEPRKKGSAKRSGIIAVFLGATLAAALVAGAVAARSFAHDSSTRGTAGPAVDVQGAAAALPAQPEVAAPVQPAPVTPTPAQAAVDPATGAKSALTGAGPAGPATPASAAVHKHAAKPLAVAPPLGATVGGNPKASNALPASPTDQAPAKPATGPSPALSKPAAAKASGGSDSLEDLIRKEVAAQKK